MSIIPDFLIAVLAAWLGATVLTRASTARAARIFVLLTLLFALWGTFRVVFNLTSSQQVRDAVSTAEAAVAALLPAALLHIVLASIEERRWSARERAALIGAYGFGMGAGYLSVSDRARPLAIRAPNRELLGLPGEVVGWTWIGIRAVIIGLAVWWAWRVWLVGRESVRRRQLSAMFAAVGCSAAGGMLTILLAQLRGPIWVGTTIMALGLALAAYSVLVQRVFLSPDVARRSFLYSVVTGLVTAGYIALLLGIERVSRAVLDVQSPLVTALALVLTIAWFDPVRLRFRTWMDRRLGSGDISYSQLLRAMGDELVTSQRPDRAIHTALAQMCSTLGVRSATVEDSGGRLLARYGDQGHRHATQLSLPLRAGEWECGTLSVGPKLSWLPYTPVEKEILSHAAAYIAASLQLAERQAEQASALQELTREREALRSRETTLAEALVHVETPPASNTVSVWALGPLRVERNGETIRRWGGAKAGTRQSEAVFVFLFDRGERGVAKDEFLEVIWPDVPLDRADLAFHRTLGGLRRMLEPDIRHGSEATAITYHNDRYRLDRSAVGYSDVAVFQERIATASRLDDPAEAITMLEEARSLYRGDYLDDCPFYGDSLYVEERRALLRGRYIDVLLALGERYEKREDHAAAAAAYREALQTAHDDCPRADDGLARLGLPI